MFWTVAVAMATGARTMTGIAVVCWAAYLGWLPVEGTWAAWTGKLASVVVFSLLALGEYVGDTLPNTPSRRKVALVVPRVAFALLCGLVIATGLRQPRAGGVLLALLGVVLGIYGGYWLRMRMARAFGRDLPAALLESAVALGISWVALGQIHREVLRFAEDAMHWGMLGR